MAQAGSGDSLDDERTQSSGEHEEPLSTEDLARGTAIGRYLVLMPIGRGGMGVVYAAYDPELDRKIALKLVREAQTRDAEQTARLNREAQAMARVVHPNVVTVHEAGSWWGHVFLAMELVEGVTLKSWLAEKPRGWREIIGLFDGAGQGLAAAHAAGLVHRDFKPENVLVGRDGRPRVTDFGLVRPIGEAAVASDESVVANPVTLPGVVMGTPAYMAPEQMVGGAVDARADQFAFAAALYEALCGVRPFIAKGLPDQYLAIKERRLQPPQPGRRVPLHLKRVLTRALSHLPQDRFATMAELLTALRRDPGARARRVATAIALLAVALSGPALLLRQNWKDSHRCDAVAHELDGVWGDAQRARLQQVFAGWAPERPEEWTRVRDFLDRYQQEWVAARRRTCELTRTGAQNPLAGGLVEACLDRRREHLQATVELLSQGDPDALALSWHAFNDLGGVKACLSTQSAPPPASQAAGQADLRRRIARAHVLNRLDRVADAQALGSAAANEAIARGEHGLASEALRALARAQHERNQGADALASLRKAVLEAQASRDDEQLFQARLELAWVQTSLLRHFDEALWELDQAESSLTPLARPPELEAQLLQARSEVLSFADRPSEALPLAERALELHRSTCDQEWELLPEMSGLANLYADLGLTAQAAPLYEKAVQLHRASGVPPEESSHDELYLGEVLILMGDTARGIDHLTHSREGVSNEGPDAVDTVHAHAWSARGWAALGDDAKADGELAKAAAGRAVVTEPEDVAESLTQRAYVELFEGQLSAAARSCQEQDDVLAPVEAVNRQASVEVAQLRAEIQRRRGELAKALESLGGPASKASELERDFAGEVAGVRALRAWLELDEGKLPPEHAGDFGAALALRERNEGPNAPTLRIPLLGLARLALDAGRRGEGLADLHRALELSERTPGDHYALAETRFALAQALAASPDGLHQARELAQSADAELGRLQEPVPLRNEVRRWLKAKKH